MKRDLRELLCCPECQGDLALQDDTPGSADVESGTLACERCARGYPIVRGVPRFVGSDQYVGSFSYEWNRWNRVQLDIANGTQESEETFREKTGFTPDDLAGKVVLDVGCGAGRFLDVASRWGARVIGVDLSYAVEASQHSVGGRDNVSVVQADVFRLPFRPGTFDAIFSIGVLHHSRDTREAFLQLPPLLKDGGAIAVWLYYYPDRLDRLATDFWRAVLRPFGLRVTYAWSWAIVTLLSWLWLKPVLSRHPWSMLRKLLPVSMHPEREWRILDTFDWYSPRYQDKQCSPGRVIGWYREAGLREIQVLDAWPTTVRARRDAARQRRAIRYELPDIRDHRIVVFGAGAAGVQTARLIQRIAPERLVAVVDNDVAKHGTICQGVRVQSFASVPREAFDLVIIASLPGHAAIHAQLRAAGVEPSAIAGLDVLDAWYRLALEYEAWAA